MISPRRMALITILLFLINVMMGLHMLSQHRVLETQRQEIARVR